MPEVAINVIANGDKPTGVGEPAVTVIAPAHRQRHLQRLRRPRPLAADHGGSGEGEHEGIRPRWRDYNGGRRGDFPRRPLARGLRRPCG